MLVPYWSDRNIEVLLDDLAYHQSWDWLMLVVEKIESVVIKERGNSDLNFSVEIHNQGCRVFRNWTTIHKDHFNWHQTGNKMQSVCVEFIKWYNEQAK